MAASNRRHQPGSWPTRPLRLRAAGAVCLFLGLFFPSSADALEGQVRVQRTVQAGQAGANAYHQRTLETGASASQTVPFGRMAVLGLNGRFLRESYASRIDSVQSDLVRRTRDLGVSWDLSLGRSRLSLSGTDFQQDDSGIGIASPGLHRQQAEASADFGSRFGRLGANGYITTSRRRELSGPDTRNRESSGSLDARTHIPILGDLVYRYSTLVDRDLSRDTRADQNSHFLAFSTRGRFAGGRGLAAVRTTSEFLNQGEKRLLSPGGTRLRLPLGGGFLLDDTPLSLDPLEGTVSPVPALYDRDRTTPTTINLGDRASQVREFGGDYRNIQYDFGETVELSSAVLYVDRTLFSPDLYRWGVYVSNDPEGRAWRALSPDTAAVAYREWGTGLQGWSVALKAPVSGRFFKLVDVKLGATVPDLFVTELEVSTQEKEVESEERSTMQSHQLTASVSYALSSAVRAGYDLSYRRRTFSDRTDIMEEKTHGFSAGWSKGLWDLSGRFELRALTGRNAGTAEMDNQSLTLGRGRSGAAQVNLSWARARNSGTGLRKISNDLGLAINWPVAPALRLYQSVSYGWLADRQQNRTSNSAVVTTTASGAPWPSMTLALERTDRWVSQEAGTGFVRFNDTSVALGWQPVPLVSLQSQVRYLARDEGEWIIRHSASWAPLSRGSVQVRLNASHYRESRNDLTQRSGGAQLEWRARQNLSLEGTIESVVVMTGGQENSPVNVGFGGTWRF